MSTMTLEIAKELDGLDDEDVLHIKRVVHEMVQMAKRERTPSATEIAKLLEMEARPLGLKVDQPD